MSNGKSGNMAATIVTSVLTSALITAGMLYLSGNLRFEIGAQQTATESENVTVEANEMVETPSVKGLTTETAVDVLKGRGLRLVVKEERADNEVPVGQICEQSPLAGSTLNSGSEVTVVVSTGPDLIVVPDVTGRSLEESKKILADAGFAVGEITEVDTGEPGTVTATVPVAGALIDLGASIEMSVAGSITVPKVVGMSVSKAKKALTDAGLKVGAIRRGYSDYMNYNAVMTQEPKAEEAVPSGTEVNLTINAD
ncbi:MAG: PASTA domain-containing protein [Deltaproteobacteria bacterium]|nr:PASTA domain-containing protein [Deltaproteobacteria bacterium]MBN2674405.1 PASTA domain-containing protein [Deltaproteobacteria bacterium]